MYTNSHFIHHSAFQQGLVSFPDKYSYSERKKRRDLYMLRLYHQYTATIKKGGTVFFDTLTYDDDHLPHLSSVIGCNSTFSCFQYEDVQKFNWLLRALLSDRYKFFLVSEYGSSSEYIDDRGRLRRATRRPHYHILFFFENQVDTVELAKLIHSSWKCGKTDSCHLSGRFRSVVVDRAKVRYNTFTSENTDTQRIVKLSSYLSKYVLKDQEYCERVQLECERYLFSKKKYDLYTALGKKAFRHDVRELTSRVMPFIRVSHDFGTDLPDDVLSLMDSEFVMQLPDSHTVKRTITLPKFYYRRRYMTLVDGTWKLNSLGSRFYGNFLEKRACRLEQLFVKAVANMPDNQKVSELLQGRSLKDLADYAVYYRGRIIDPSTIDTMPSKLDIVRRYVLAFSVENQTNKTVSNEILRNYSVHFRTVTRRRWQWSFIDDTLIPVRVRTRERYKLPLRTFDWRDWIIDDTWFSGHFNFDFLLFLIFSFFQRVENQQDVVKRKVDELSRRFHHEFSIATKF